MMETLDASPNRYLLTGEDLVSTRRLRVVQKERWCLCGDDDVMVRVTAG